MLQRQYLAERGRLTAHTNFTERGVVPYEIPESVAARMMPYFASENAGPFRADDYVDGFNSSDLPEKTVRRLNEENIYYGTPDSSIQAALEDYLKLISGSVSDELLNNFSVVNIRAWETKPGAAFGPSAWHVDGSSPFLTKIMLYPNGASPAKGSFEFFDRSGVRRVLDSDRPLAVLFDSAVLLHRGVPSPTERRPAIEITLAPDFDTTSFLAFAGQNARFPRAHLRKLEEGLETASGDVPSRVLPAGTGGITGTKCQPAEMSEMSMVQPQASVTDAATFNTSGKVNIGGGPNFKHEGWLNFDEFPGAAEQSVKLSEETVLPVPSGTVDIVYSSHCFEHLPEGAINRCLDEALRILRRDGLLLVKLPSYEAILEAYRNGDAAFFDLWNIGGVASTWGARQIEDNLANRASMIFCGFWNSAYGHEFGGMRKLKKKSFRRSIVPFFREAFARMMAAFRGKKTAGASASTESASVGQAAYHGPAALPLHVVEDILSLGSPQEIARTLRAHVIATEPDRTFNHQCAFSVAEFSDLLRQRGFELLTTDKTRICSGYADVPGIREMYEISSYYLAKPKG